MELRSYYHHFRNIDHRLQTQFSFAQRIKQFAKQKGVSQIQPYVLLVICLAAVLLITIIVVVCCRKYHIREMYNQTPQYFSYKPNLTLPQLIRFQKQIKALTEQYGHQVKRKQTYDGRYVQVIFKTHNNCLYFTNQQQKDCYFQIQIIKLSSVIQIGYVHKKEVSKICRLVDGKHQINLDQYGVSVRTDGTVFVNGNNCTNFNWKVQCGDTIGIGMTQHEGGIRVWITRNGVIQNPPTEQQVAKHIQIKEQKNEKQQTTRKLQKNKINAFLEQQEQKQQKRRQKQQIQAAKKRIQIKASKQFKYYAVLISQSPMQPIQTSVVNWNIGGQAFRLYDGKYMVGLLR